MHMRRLAAPGLAVVVSAAALLAGCTTLPNVDAEGCGNLVVNAGEDCDGFGDLGDGTKCGAPDADNACFFVCDDQGAVCPDGWGCGVNGRCRRPSGNFEPGPGSPWLFRVGDFAIGDVDGDGFQDVIGNEEQELTVRFGSETGELASEVNLLTREPQGPVTFGQFDEDGLMDVLVPINGGLFVLRGDASRTLEPIAYSPIEIQVPSGGAKLFPVESDGGANLNTEMVVVAGDVMQFINSSAPATTLPSACNGACVVTDIAGDAPVTDVNGDPVRAEFALPFRGATSVYIYTSTGTPSGGDLAPTLLAEVPLGPGLKVDLGAYLADIDGDGDTDLIVSVRNATNHPKVAVAINLGGGTFNTATSRQVFDRGTSGDAEWPIAVGNLAGDKKADFVFPDFIAISDYGINNPFAVPLTLTPTQFITSDSWSEAVIGDFNGDGVADAATTIEGRDGLDVFLNAPTVDMSGKLIGSGIFNKFHIDTTNPPRNLRAADFDGDFIGDIAFAELGFGAKPDAVSVVFGNTAGGPTAPVHMGSMGFVEVLEPVSNVVGLEGIDAIADLFVLSSSFPDRSSTSVALLQGSSSRRMLSPFTLQPTGGVDPDVPRSALFGHFTPDDDDSRDIVAISDAALVFDQNNTTEKVSHAWMVPGGPGGTLDAAGANFVELPAYTAFDTGCAVWASGDLDGDGRDEIVGIDNSNGCFGMGFSPAPRMAVVHSVGGGGTPFDTVVSDLGTDARAVVRLELTDLDNDGDLDLLALFAGEARGSKLDPNTPVEGAAAAVIWNVNGALSPTGVSTVIFDKGRRFFDVAPIHIDDSGVPALAILATGGVFTATLDPETKVYAAPTRLFNQAGEGQLEVGDLNADGLEDIAFTVADDVHVRLAQPAVSRGEEMAGGIGTQGGGQ